MKKTLLLVLSSIIIGIIGLSAPLAGFSTGNPGPAPPRPDTPFIDVIRNPRFFLNLLLNLKSANFTDDTVYLNSQPFDVTYSSSLTNVNIVEALLNPQILRDRFNVTLNRMSNLNVTLFAPYGLMATNIWANVSLPAQEFWNNVTISKSNFTENLFRPYFTVMGVISSVDPDHDGNATAASLDTIVTTINTYESLSIRDKVRFLYQRLTHILLIDPSAIVWLGIFHQQPINLLLPVEYLGKFPLYFRTFLLRFQMAYNSLLSIVSPNISFVQKNYMNISKETTMKGERVTILYDPDRSVINALAVLKTNKTLAKQPFTGDESFTFVTNFHVVESIWGYVNFSSGLKGYPDNDFLRLLRIVPPTPGGQLAIDHFWNATLGPQWMRIKGLLSPVAEYQIPQIKPLKNAWRTFEVAQLKINDLKFVKLPQGIGIGQLNFTYVNHREHGLFVFNDTNGNHYLDIGMRSDVPGSQNVLPNSTEITGKVIFRRFESTIVYKPQTSSDVLSFGRSVTNVNASIVPFSQPSDLALANDSVSDVHTVSELGTKFHFSVASGQAQLKYDVIIGDWTNNEELQGLSLVNIVSTTVINSESTHKIQNIISDTNQEVNASTDAQRIRSVRFGRGSSDADFKYDIDSLSYLWDNTSNETAYGMLLPLKFLEFTSSMMTSDGQVVHSLMNDVSIQKYVFALSYPKWDGKSIQHDPTFSTASGVAAESDWDSVGEDTTSSGVFGFEWLTLVAIVTLIPRRVIHRRNFSV